MDIVNATGIVAGVFTASSMLPQLVKIIKEKKVEDVSLWMLIILLSGISLWIIYGFMKKDAPIICTNIFSLLVNIATMILRIKYKK